MYIKLPSNYVDPKTMAPLPAAVMVITDAQFQMRAGATILQTAVYASAAAAAAGVDPISESSLALTPGELAAQQPALLAACYTVLLGRTIYLGASLVTP